jgi:hypothetical protein
MHQSVSVAGEELESWAGGAAMHFYAGSRLATSYHTGIEVVASPLIPTDTLTLDGQDLEGVAFVSGAALWMNHLRIVGLTMRLGVGPTAVHLIEGSGAIEEQTAFGLAELVGIGHEFKPTANVRFDLALAGMFTQAFTGSDERHSVDRVHSEGVMLSLGFAYGAALDMQSHAK